MKNYLVIFILILSINVQSQNNNTQAAIYNIGIGGIMSSIGAAINKKPNEKLGKVMLKGFVQGALGGSVVYGSKQMVYHFHKNNRLDNLWKAKLVNSVGISMIENASLNNNFYDKWHINFGFNRLEVDINNNFKVHYKVLPLALIGTIVTLKNGKFNLKYSVQTVTPVFTSNEFSNPFTFSNSIAIKNENIKSSLAHEFIHTLQYDDFMSINMYFDKQKTKWKNKYSFIRKQSKWIYMDIPSGVTLRGLYVLEKNNQKCYYDNYFEHEANFYSNKRPCR